MKKLFGIQAELNITADEDVVKGIGQGIKNGTVVIGDIVKEIKPLIVESLKKHIEEEVSTEKKTS